MSITTNVSDEVALVTPGDFLVGRNFLEAVLNEVDDLGNKRPVLVHRVSYLWIRMCLNDGMPFSPICLACGPGKSLGTAHFDSVIFSAKDILKNADAFIRTRRLRPNGGTVKDFNRLCAARAKKFDPPRKSNDKS